MNNLALTILVISCLIGQFNASPQRRIVSVPNPNSAHNHTETHEFPTLMYVSATGPVDIVHYVWDFSNKPTVLIALTPLNASMRIDWQKWQQNDGHFISFTEPPIYRTALVISRIFQYNDSSNKATLPGADDTDICDNQVIAYDMGNLTWTRSRTSARSNEYVMVEMVGTNAELLGRGHIQIMMKTAGERDFDDDIPYMVHSENGTLIDVVLDRLDTNVAFKAARFAAEVVLVASEQASPLSPGFQCNTRMSLDDEHTPGVFKVIEIVSPSSRQYKNGSYVNYRPISFTSYDRVIRSSTPVHISMPKYVMASAEDVLHLPQITSLFKLEEYSREMLVQSFNISFGRTEDGYYKHTQLNTWSFEFGYGAPPEERFSLFVVVVTGMGFVFPVLCLLLGGFIVFVKRLRSLIS